MIDQLPAMLVTLATLVCCLMIGLGFLYRPSRASAIWSGAFVAAMVASYVSAARSVAGSGDAAWLDAATAGLLVLAVGLVWVGLRAHRRRRRVMIIPTFTIAAGLAILLLLSTRTDVAGTEAAEWLRALTAGLVGLAATGIAVELALVRATQRTVRIPLLVGAGITLVYAGIWIGAGAPWDGSGRLSSSLPTVAEFIPTLAIILLVTALTTVLLFARAEVAPTAEQAAGGFRAVARDRLARAERLDDSWWSLLDVRLDDPVALREASSTLAYTRVLDRFADDVAAVFPAEADIDRVEPTRFLVLLPRHEPSVRPPPAHAPRPRVHGVGRAAARRAALGERRVGERRRGRLRPRRPHRRGIRRRRCGSALRRRRVGARRVGGRPGGCRVARPVGSIR